MNPIGFISEHKKETVIGIGLIIIAGVAIWKGPALYRKVKTKRSLREKVKKVHMEGPYPETFIAELNKFHETLNTDASKDVAPVFHAPPKGDAFGPLPQLKYQMPTREEIARRSADNIPDDVMAENIRRIQEKETEGNKEIKAIAAKIYGDKPIVPAVPPTETEYGEDGYPIGYEEISLREFLRLQSVKNGEEFDMQTEEGRAVYAEWLATRPKIHHTIMESAFVKEALAELSKTSGSEEDKWVIVPEDQAHIAEHQWILQKLAGQETLYERFELDEAERQYRREGIIKSLGDDVWERWINWVEPAEEPKAPVKEEPKKPAAKRSHKKKEVTPKDGE